MLRTSIRPIAKQKQLDGWYTTTLTSDTVNGNPLNKEENGEEAHGDKHHITVAGFLFNITVEEFATHHFQNKGYLKKRCRNQE